MVVILDIDTNQTTKIHNDKAALMGSLSSKDILVGFNNYNYDDIILWAIKTDQDPYEISKQILNNEFRRKVNCGHLTLDVKQEVQNKSLSLKEVMANLGLDIIEAPVDFEKEKLTDEEIKMVFRYCENDVKATAEIFKKREDYFTSKFEIAEAFNLNPTDVKKTRANLSATVLKAIKINDHKRDRLTLKYDNRLKLNELPKSILEFYDDIVKSYQEGGDEKELEKSQFEYKLSGLTHTYGFGGLHAAKENYVREGHFLHIDAKSYFPTLKINNGFISRAAKIPERYQQIYEERLKLAAAKDPKAEIYKILLNSTFGACKSEYNPLFDPMQFNNIVVNGQLILTHLILLLDPFVELIQSNTDGLIVRYEDKSDREMIDETIKRFSQQYELKFSVSDIDKIAQRDVNNYCVRFKDGTIKSNGLMKNFEGGNWERNSFSIIDTALVNYYMYEIPIQKTVINIFKKDISAFQLVAKSGKFEGMVEEVYENGSMVMKPIQKVNRVFATNDPLRGGIYKVRDGKYQKSTNSPDRAIVWNGDLKEFNKRKIDLNWYVKMIQNQLF